MKSLLQRILLFILIFAQGLFGNIRNANAQTSLPDSLRQLLVYLHDSTTNKKLKQEIKDALALYINDTINDSLADKFLIIEDSLLDNYQLPHEIIISYAEKLVQVLKYRFASEVPLRYVRCLDNLGSLYAMHGDYKKALPLQLQALEIRKKLLGESHIDYANNLDRIAGSYRDLGEYEQALPLYQKELEIRKKITGEETADYATSLENLAILFEYMGKFKDALPLYQKDLEITRKILGEEDPEYATTLDNFGGLFWEMGEYEKAVPLLQQALLIRKKKLGEEHPDYAYSLNNLGLLFKTMGQYEKALPLYQQALAIRKKIFGEYHSDYASTLNNLAVLYYSVGEYERAQPLFEKDLEITKRLLGEESPDYATTLDNLAFLYKSMARYEKALPLSQQALAIRKKILKEEHPDYSISLNNLAVIYEGMGQYEKAGILLRQVLAIRRKVLGEENPLYAHSLNNLAALYQHLNQDDKALPLYQQALTIRKKVFGEESPDYAESLNNIAGVYSHMGLFGKAFPLYQQALAIRKKTLGEEHPQYASSLNDLASLYEASGRYDKAPGLYQQALEIRKKVLGEAHPDYVSSLNYLGRLDMILNNKSNAADLLIQANNTELSYILRTYSSLSEQEKMIFLKKEETQFGLLPSLLFSQHFMQPKILSQVYANELSLKGMVLEDQQRVFSNIRKSKDTSVLELYNQWSFNKAFLGKQLLLPVTKRLSYLDSLEEATNQLEQQLSRVSAAFRNQQQNQAITPADVSHKLSEGEAAIEFIKFQLYNKKWTDSTVYAAVLLLPGDSIPKFIPLFEEKKLGYLLQNTGIGEFYPATNSSSKYLAAKRKSLYDLVWKPFEKYLTGVNRIYYAPTGLLHRVAFQALFYDTAHLLIDKYRLNQVFSTRSVALPPYAAQPSSISLWGNIQYNLSTDPSGSQLDAVVKRGLSMSSFNFYTSDTRSVRGGAFSKLPGTKSEIDSIYNVCMNTGIEIADVSGTVATEEAFKALDGKSPQILHLATHGFFLPVKQSQSNAKDINSPDNAFSVQQNPMFRSGLVLAGANSTWEGGNIPGREEDGILTAYEIAQMDLSNTDLVVLSACKTALGDLTGNEGVIGLQRAFKMAGVKQMILSLWQVPDQQTVELMTMFYRNLISGQSSREALYSAQFKMKEKYPPYYWAAFILVE